MTLEQVVPVVGMEVVANRDIDLLYGQGKTVKVFEAMRGVITEIYGPISDEDGAAPWVHIQWPEGVQSLTRFEWPLHPFLTQLGEVASIRPADNHSTEQGNR